MKFSIDNSSANERTDSKMSMRYSKIYEGSQDPIRASKSSAGYDLFAYTNTTVAIMPHETVKIGTGVKFEIIDGYQINIPANLSTIKLVWNTKLNTCFNSVT